MAPDAGLLEELRRRLQEVESAHRSDARGAAERFWAELRTSETGRPDRRPADRPSQGSSDREGRRRPARGPALRRPAPARRGPWATVLPEVAESVDPRDCDWLDHASMPPEALAERAAAGPTIPERSEPVILKAEAAIGMDLVRHDDDSLVDAVDHIAGLRALHDVMLVNTVAELERRGVDAPGGLSRIDWLRSLDPTLTGGQAKAFVTVARAVCEPRWRELGARVSQQRITVAKAAHIVEFHERLQRVADADELARAVDDLVAQGPELSPEDFTRLVRQHTEEVRPPKDDERLDEGRRASRGLWFGQPSASGMVTMRGLLDPEAAAVIKSAIDPLSVPCPTKDPRGRTIDEDPRSPAKRRADALVEIVERGVASTKGLPTTDKAKVVVTIDHDVLAGQLRGAGHTMSGEVLSTGIIRRLACDAGIIPMVLGRAGEPLDVGREERLVTRAMRTALWQRDGRCSFPGCGCPAQWTDAHHVRPWWSGGETTLENLALLCRRHHTYVHRHDLTATVTATEVTWHV